MTAPSPRTGGHWRLGPGIFVARPRLIIAAAADIRARAAQEDQGQAVILLLILTACIASVAAGLLGFSALFDRRRGGQSDCRYRLHQ